MNGANFIDVEKSGRLLSLLNSKGFNLSPHNFPVTTKSHAVQWELVKQGAAIIVMLEDIGDAEPLVERINVSELKLIEAELWIVTHKELRTSIRVRKVFDFLVAEFSDY